MTNCCKTCGIDAEELLTRLRTHVAKLDTLIWEYEMADD